MFLNLGPPELGIKCSLEQCVALAKSSGYEGIDVDIFEVQKLVAEKDTKYVRDLIADAGLKIGSWIWFDHFGFSDDDALFQEQLDALPSLSEVAEAIGATRVLSWILPYSDSLTFERNFDQHVARIGAAMKILNDHGQHMALEYIGPITFRDGHAHEFISTQKAALELIAAVGSPNVGLIMDSWHWYTSSGTIEDIRNLPGDLAVFVHLSDAPPDTPVDSQMDDVRRLPGSTGVINNVAFLRALQSIGYAGPITAEPFSAEINALPDEDAAKLTADAMAELLAQAGIN